MELLTLTRQDGVALLTINRPKVLNALNSAVLDELSSAFAQMEGDDQVGAVIITGSGSKSFVAGADIKELAQLGPVTAKAASERGQRILRGIECFPKPVIAAINGFALGGGCELALACHLRVASTNARLGLPEVSLGLLPGYGGTQRLSRLVGKGLALELILTGQMIGAERAYEMGLVNHVTEPAELMTKCRDLATSILKQGPLATRLAMEAVNHGLEMPLADGERLECNLFAVLLASEDSKEGMAAFLEKRKPDFKGK